MRAERALTSPVLVMLGGFGLILVALSYASRASAQELPGTDESIVPGMPITVAGITGYDAAGRRDPFLPLFGQATGGTSGPRFELLKLTGIFRGSGANSLIVLEDPSHRGHFVRLGQEIGAGRLVEILPQGAVFEVRDYGASRRVVLRLERSPERP
jgi:hypothetical protein